MKTLIKFAFSSTTIEEQNIKNTNINTIILKSCNLILSTKMSQSNINIVVL